MTLKKIIQTLAHNHAADASHRVEEVDHKVAEIQEEVAQSRARADELYRLTNDKFYQFIMSLRSRDVH